MAAPAPAIKRIPAPNQRPPLQGIGPDSLRALQRRAAEIPVAIAVWRPALPELAAALTRVVPAQQVVINLLLAALGQIAIAARQVEQDQLPMAMASAERSVATGGFASVKARVDTVNEEARRLLSGAVNRAMDAVVAGLAEPAQTAATKTATLLTEARSAYDRAKLESSLPDFDEELDRKARIWERTVAGWPLATRMQRVLELYRNPALDDQQARALESAIRPLATTTAAEGVAALKRSAVTAALPTGAASAENAAAITFLNASAARMAARNASDALGQAGETLRQCEQIFLKTAGRDASDPSSVKGINYNGGVGFSTRPQAPDAPQWLARYAVATAPVRLLPWETIDQSVFKPRKGAAK